MSGLHSILMKYTDLFGGSLKKILDNRFFFFSLFEIYTYQYFSLFFSHYLLIYFVSLVLFLFLFLFSLLYIIPETNVSLQKQPENGESKKSMKEKKREKITETIIKREMEILPQKTNKGKWRK